MFRSQVPPVCTHSDQADTSLEVTFPQVLILGIFDDGDVLSLDG
jgi:hypothetical protein